MPSGFVGSGIFIEVETGDAREPDFHRLTGTIREVIEFGPGPAALIVDLQRPVTLSVGTFSQLLVLGEAEHFGAKLLESARSQLTIRVPVRLYTTTDMAAVSRFKQTKRIPPSKDYFGRAGVTLES